MLSESLCGSNTVKRFNIIFIRHNFSLVSGQFGEGAVQFFADPLVFLLFGEEFVCNTHV